MAKNSLLCGWSYGTPKEVYRRLVKAGVEISYTTVYETLRRGDNAEYNQMAHEVEAEGEDAKLRMFLKSFVVFNVSQCDGLDQAAFIRRMVPMAETGLMPMPTSKPTVHEMFITVGSQPPPISDEASCIA